MDKASPIKKSAVFIVLGLALRLILMPVTLHADMVFVHYFPSYLSGRGVWDIYGYFGSRFTEMFGLSYYPPLTYYLTAFFQFLLKPVNPDLIAWLNGFHEASVAGAQEGVVHFLSGLPVSKTLWIIFWMKFPYLVAEIACFAAVFNFFKSPDEKKRLTALWLLNPVLIFSSYVFGQYRIFPFLFMSLSALMLSRDRKGLSGIFYGFACLMDNYAVLLFLFMFFISGEKTRQKIRWASGVIFTVVAVLVPLYFSSGGQVLNAYFSPHLLRTAVARGIFNHHLAIVNPICKIIFLGSYGWIFFRLATKKKNPDKACQSDLFIYVPASLLFILYATMITSVHYLMWCFPFLFIIQVRGEPWRPFWTWCLTGLLFLFNLDGRSLNMGLFAPLNPVYFSSLPSLHELMSHFLPWGKVIVLARFIFSGICLYFAAALWKARIEPALKA